VPKQVDVVRNARNAGVMIPGFNIPYLPIMAPIVRAVVDTDSFALISTAQVEWQTLESKGPREVLEEFEKWDDPDHVRLHIDHVCSIDEVTHESNDYCAIIAEAIEMGYPSVMIDGSHEPDLDNNIAVTRRIVELAHKNDVLVEAEVGTVFGYEIEHMPPYEKIFSERMGFATEAEVKRIVKETECDWLSVAAGNFHGAMAGIGRFQDKAEAQLDVDHIGALSEAAGVPLVLHGGSGIRIDQLRAAFKKGVAKINVAKDLRSRYQNVMKESGDVAEAQQVVYDRTVWLIKEHYQIAGISKLALGAEL